jgi:hypothetical protein
VADDDLAFLCERILPHLNERQRRAAARIVGHGGVKSVSAASGLSLYAVQKGHEMWTRESDPWGSKTSVGAVSWAFLDLRIRRPVGWCTR